MTVIRISINGDSKVAEKKAKALATLANKLDQKTLTALAKVVKSDPQKVELAKTFLGL
jgi:hypothetical protein